MSNSRYDFDAASPSPFHRTTTRLLYVSTATYGGDWHSLVHTHTCAELFYIVGGMGTFQVEDIFFPVGSDDMVIINPNVQHTEFSCSLNPLEYVVMGVDGLEFIAQSPQSNRYHLLHCPGNREETLGYLRTMLVELKERASGYHLICQDLLEVLILRILRHSSLSLTPVPSCGRSRKECATIRRYIDHHFKEPISLDLLSQVAHMNKYYLVHIFSQEFGISPINYLISRRIAESKRLLSGTDHSLSQIAHMLGFSSPSYFSQSFRKLVGFSPLEYRKRSQCL